ncbi:carboxypeptidase-like regulatory domain-containing protein [Flavobacterium azooxidireducens]|uniref:Carboxypeptidase-like regulatory domain-containing protein n=1 Tax=Flavobacterium azooxidireducens TaxID=1871076 RepID=A0ABY4KDN2_9FLAO|nr:carboxypeptidase-like regulatory domain-containing protein [Flavobacterium azooxidireducens]UPQ78882.1 carboxypeptidase-like regulatory domain-containing protein [Flavobacterium azooxidireducens]
MKYFVVFLLLITFQLTAQETERTEKVTGTVLNDSDSKPLSNVNIINMNSVRGSISNNEGVFEISVQVNDTLHISLIGFQSIRVRVTNDWIKSKNTQIKLTEKAIALEEVVLTPYNLTGYLQIDAKHIPVNNNQRYGISGLNYGYEAGQYSPNAFNRVLGSIFNPTDMLYNFFGNKPRELRKLKEMKKDDTVRNLLESKFDRETIAIMLGIDKKEIPEILERCNYSESFIKTANDLQVLDAINDCYEEYKILKRK